MRPPALTHPSAAVFLGDCLDVLAEMPDDSVDAIVTDPPYGLGFMGKAWDDLPPGLDWAVECRRVLKPGGHLLAFGGTRTWHRLAVAVEDAGFEVRDSIAWLYGSGFPKSLDVSKAIDKAAGAVREVVGERTSAYGTDTATGDRVSRTGGGAGLWVGAEPKAVPLRSQEAATPAAQQWQGWGTALKPAFEPIVVARKPLVGNVAANVLAHGTGALNIDGCRVESSDGFEKAWDRPVRTNIGRPEGMFQTGIQREVDLSDHKPVGGRWPANVLLDGDAAAELDEQSGTSTSAVGRKQTSTRAATQGATHGGTSGGYNYATRDAEVGYTDSGGASRFFPTFRYQAKAPTRERPSYIADDGSKVAHATVKPLALMRWLVRLVTPPGGTVLDTFAGSGATVEAAIEEGFFAFGIEREESYLPLIQVRLDRVGAPE